MPPILRGRVQRHLVEPFDRFDYLLRAGGQSSMDYAPWRAQRAYDNDETSYFLEDLPLPSANPSGASSPFLPPSSRPDWMVASTYPAILAADAGEWVGDVLIEPNYPLEADWDDPNPPSPATKRGFVGLAPDGSPSIEIRTFLGDHGVHVSSFIPMLGGESAKHAGVRFQVYLQSTWDFAEVPVGGKFGGGLWGGGLDSTGGAPPWRQNGITVRNIWGISPSTGNVNIRAYAYQFNRDQAARDTFDGTNVFGSKPGLVSNILVPGQWHTFEYEGFINTPNRTDGFCRFWIDGTFISEMTGCIWAFDDELGWKGFVVGHSWDDATPCPQDQNYWIKNITFYLPE